MARAALQASGRKTTGPPGLALLVAHALACESGINAPHWLGIVRAC